MKAESRDDPLHQFAIAVPADENVRLLSTIGQRHHQLTAMPEGDNDCAILARPLLHVVVPDRFNSQHSTENTNEEGPHGWKEDEFQSFRHRAITVAR